MFSSIHSTSLGSDFVYSATTNFSFSLASSIEFYLNIDLISLATALLLLLLET